MPKPHCSVVARTTSDSTLGIYRLKIRNAVTCIEDLGQGRAERVGSIMPSDAYVKAKLSPANFHASQDDEPWRSQPMLVANKKKTNRIEPC